jgi:malate synthase
MPVAQPATLSPRGVTTNTIIAHPPVAPQDVVLTREALRFLTDLHRMFERRRRKLLDLRATRREELDRGQLPDFLPSTKHIRESEWCVAPIPHDLVDRRVEITGPVDRKMIINALNSGANVFMADFEDSNAPSWINVLEGQVNLRDAVRRTIQFTSPEGKHYALAEDIATLLVRPRGWHLVEKHLLVDGDPISASLFDFGLFLYHNGVEQLARGTRPYFYLPKLENRLEARLWNDVFVFAQEYLHLPLGTIRATVLIENILAAFEMDEILWELKDHSAGLNCGRWDYIFSFIKAFRNHPQFVLPDRGQVTMERHFMRSYVDKLIQTCHRRGIHAIGGMAAQIPVRSDPAANDLAMQRVRDDKLREVRAGHDGTWVAHPGLVPVAREIFDEYMPQANQIDRIQSEKSISAADLLRVPRGTITLSGLRHNVDVGIRYLEAWLRGVGCVPIYNLMEDAATAEICRSQVWQWVRHGARLDDGPVVTPALVRLTIAEELQKMRDTADANPESRSRLRLAASEFEHMMTSDELPEWLTTIAYEHLA